MTQSIPKYLTTTIAMLLIATATPHPVRGQNFDDAKSAKQMNQANALVRDGKFGEAIQEYGKITTGETARDMLAYNQAVAHFRNGEVDAAQSLFETGASSTNTAIAADSRYNLGNCQYTRALNTAKQDRTAAIEQLTDAISHYRGSLRGNPDNVDARANIELASELIRKLREEQEQQEQQNQDQQDQKPQQQDQSGQGEDEPQKDSQTTDEEKQNKEQDSSDKSDSDESKSDEQSDENRSGAETQNDPSKSNDENESESDQPNEQQPGDPRSDSQDKQNQASGEQESAQEQEQPASADQQDSQTGQPQNRQQPNPGQQSAAESSPPEEEMGVNETNDKTVPTGDLTAANQQDKNGDPGKRVAMPDPDAREGLITREEALKMLQAVRDRDMLRRLKQERIERTRHVPVDRDW